MPDPTPAAKTTEQELAELMLELSSNPATRGATLQAIKKVRPDTVIPELENQAAIDKVREDLQKDNDSLRQELNQFKLTSAFESKRRDVQGKYGLSDEELVKAETLFKEGKIADYDTAAEHVRLSKQLNVPTPARRGPRTKPFEGIDFDKFQANPEQAALEEMYNALDDINSGRVQIQ